MASNPTSDDREYHRDKLTAKAGDESARLELAARADVRPEILYYLTEDESPDVRRELASNDATPRQADLLLAEDEEEAVRAELAGKVSRLVPDLDPSAQDKVQQLTIQVLEVLARDQATRVRQILAETLQDVASAPPQVINRLARDAEIVVAKPVLTFSPVLSDEDLLDIIGNSPIAGALGAIAERDGVGEVVSDAIAGSDDIGAIGLLLGNESAQIREETLDAIIDRAEPIESWHLPLVKRPKLPAKAAISLARFVAQNLVSALLGRGDILAGDIPAIRRIVDERIASGSLEGESLIEHWEKLGGDKKGKELVDLDEIQGANEGKKVDDESPDARVAALSEAGDLKADVLVDAFADGDVEFAVAAVAKMGKLDADLVQKASDSGDPTAIIAVCHAAGVPAKMLVNAQRAMGGISLADTIKPSGDGYPVDKAAMKKVLEDLS